jgi:hypothetical protein
MILNGCHLMFAISIMSLSKEGEACTASVREGETRASLPVPLEPNLLKHNTATPFKETSLQFDVCVHLRLTVDAAAAAAPHQQLHILSLFL